MIFSGFFMWKVELSLSLFPLWLHDIFAIVHGYEAMLAFLAIIIWHMYNVHLNPDRFPGTMLWWHGQLSEHEMKEEHPLEYEEIMARRSKEQAAEVGNR